MIGINLATVCFLIAKARQLDAKEATIAADEGSNAVDDNFAGVLAEGGDDAADQASDGADASEEEIASVLADLNVDELARLVALTWVGRGDYAAEEWAAAVQHAAERRTGPTADYLLGTPLLGDLLEEGLAAFGLSCVGEDVEADVPRDAPITRRQAAGEPMAIRRRGSSGNDPAR